jgi:RNA-binding protein 39
MALEQMDGFELAGRQVHSVAFSDTLDLANPTLQLRVNTVHEKGTASRMTTDSLDETGGTCPHAHSPYPCIL